MLGSDYSVVEENNKDFKFYCHYLRDDARADQICKYQADKPETIAGVQINYFTLTYFGKKLATIDLRFNSDAFETVTEALEKKYGRGKELEKNIVQNRLGAKFENVFVEWRVNDSSITAERFYKDLGSSQVHFTSDIAMKEYERRKKLYTQQNPENDL